MKWNKELSSKFLLLMVNPKPTPIFESKFVVKDDMFHKIGFERV